MNPVYEKLIAAFNSIREKTDFVPKVGLILGSGLGDYGNTVRQVCTVDYRDIEGFPVSTVPGHVGRYIFGYVGEVPVVIMQGRVHFYEGYRIEDVVMPTRLMVMMGAKFIFLTNAVGSINPDITAGDFMMITDHIMYGVPSPLIGENIEELGTRFPDMSTVYSPRLQKQIEKAAEKISVPLKRGVYIQTSGPQFETPAEIRAYGIMGADAVGMSTACEAVAARHMGAEICGISCVSNLAAGIAKNPLTHAEVQETANRVAPLFKALVTETILNIASL